MVGLFFQVSLNDGWVEQESAVCQGVDAAVRGAKVGLDENTKPRLSIQVVAVINMAGGWAGGCSADADWVGSYNEDDDDDPDDDKIDNTNADVDNGNYNYDDDDDIDKMQRTKPVTKSKQQGQTATSMIRQILNANQGHSQPGCFVLIKCQRIYVSAAQQNNFIYILKLVNFSSSSSTR